MIKNLAGQIGLSYALEILEMKLNIRENARFVVPEGSLKDYYKILKPLKLKLAISDFSLSPVESKANAKVPEYHEYMRKTRRNSNAIEGYVVLYVSTKDPNVLKANEANHAAMGRLLGYPKCCISSFVEDAQEKRRISEFLTSGSLYRIHAKQDLKLHPYYMNLLHKDDGLKFLSHVPCSLQCEESQKIARRRVEMIENMDPFYSDEIAEKLRGTHFHNGSRYQYF